MSETEEELYERKIWTISEMCSNHNHSMSINQHINGIIIITFSFSSVFSSQSWNHNVFLSFRTDSRKTFVDHVYTTFVQQGIYTYKDDKILLIDPSFKKAIKKSDIVIIVFSKNYADSSWLRKQKRKYGEAFVKHELENKNKVESCRRIKSLTGMNQRASNKLFTQFHRGCS
ncbi:unnamed protein product [Lactuca virosa]|uniref:TIR domain-containing protein n=1 Tax=Lactuca virosa TaxID=75947 RepID=A0AAU9MNS2_9ASTR|nr:unnamed protein product [Lactuca virosa]